MTSNGLNTSVTSRLKVAVYLLVLLAVGAFAYMESSPGIFGLACVAVVASWLIVESRWGRPLPRWILNIVVLAAAGVFWGEVTAWLSQSLVIALGHFMIALILCKLFEKKSIRDLAQTVILSFLLAVASAMMFSSTITFALILGGFLGMLVYTLVLMNLQVNVERYSVDRNTALVMPVARHWARLGEDLRRLTWKSWAMLIPLALVMFVAVPRARSSGFFNNLGAGVAMQTGYSDLVQFHEFGELTESDTVVMTVRLFWHHNQENVGAEITQPYFRGAVLDMYDGESRRWYVSGALQQTYTDAPLSQMRWAQLRPQSPHTESNLIDQEYTIFDTRRDMTMFTMAPNPPVAAFIYDDPRTKNLRTSLEDLGVRIGSIPPRTLHYVVSSVARPDPSMYIGKDSVRPGDMGPQVVQPRTGTGAAAQPTTTPPTASATPPATPSPIVAAGAGAGATVATNDRPAEARSRGPGYTPRPPFVIPEQIRELARRTAGPDLLPADPTEPARADTILQIKGRFESFLRTSYPYSLNSRQVQKGLDPTADFLLHRQQIGGNCEYFASAMVMLCRSVGINARPVAGYLGSEFNNVTMEYVVRAKDAHLWAEVYAPGSGWLISDPSPISMVSNATNWPIGRWAMDVVQAVENFWLSSVVSFDNESRAALLARTINFFTLIYEGAVNEMHAFKLSLTGQVGAWQRAATIAFLAGMTTVTWWFVRRFRQDGRLLVMGETSGVRRFGKTSGDHAFVDELFNLVSHSGAVRRPDQTAREFAEEQRAQFGEHAADAQWLVDTYYGLRFGMLRADAKLRTQIAAVVRRVKEGLRRQKTSAS